MKVKDQEQWQAHWEPYHAAVAERDRFKNEVLQPVVDEYNSLGAEVTRLYNTTMSTWFES